MLVNGQEPTDDSPVSVEAGEPVSYQINPLGPSDVWAGAKSQMAFGPGAMTGTSWSLTSGSYSVPDTDKHGPSSGQVFFRAGQQDNFISANIVATGTSAVFDVSGKIKVTWPQITANATYGKAGIYHLDQTLGWIDYDKSKYDHRTAPARIGLLKTDSKGNWNDGAVFKFDPGSNASGSFSFLQIIHAGSNRILETSSTRSTLRVTEDVLDTVLPYPNYIANGTVDSPGQEGVVAGSLRKEIINDNFSMYLLYKSSKAGSIAVPLKVANWNYSITAVSGGVDWTVVSASSPSGDFVEHYQMPEWSDNIVNMGFADEAV